MKQAEKNGLHVREITEQEYIDFTKDKDVNPLHSIGYYRRLKEHGDTARLYGGFDGQGNLKIAMPARLVKAWKLFHWLYAPLGFVVEPYDDYETIQNFLEGLKELVKDDNVMYFRFESDVEYQQHDENGDVVPDGYHHEDYRQHLMDMGLEAGELKTGYDASRQARWASVLDLVEYKDGRNGLHATSSQLKAFDEHFTMKTPEQIHDAMELKTRQSLKLALRPYIKVRELGYEELDLLKKLEDSAAGHHGFTATSYGMDQAQFKGYGEDCEVLYAWLDTKAYLDYMEDQYEKACAHRDERIAKAEASPGRRNKKAMNTAIADCEAAQKKYEEAQALLEEHGAEIPLSAAMFLKTPTETIYMSSGSNRDFMRFAGAFAIQWTAINRALERKALRYNFWGISGIFDPEDPSYGVYAFKKGFNARVVEYAGDFTYVFKPAITKMYRSYLKSKDIPA